MEVETYEFCLPHQKFLPRNIENILGMVSEKICEIYRYICSRNGFTLNLLYLIHY